MDKTTMEAAHKDRLQETVIESLAESLQIAKADAENFRTTAQVLGTIVTGLLGAASDNGTYVLSPEEWQTAQQKTVRWQLTPDGGVSLTTE